MSNPFLQIQHLASEMWNERKGMDHTSDDKSKKRHAKRISKLLSEIKSLKWEQEFDLINDLYFNGEKILSYHETE